VTLASGNETYFVVVATLDEVRRFAMTLPRTTGRQWLLADRAHEGGCVRSQRQRCRRRSNDGRWCLKGPTSFMIAAIAAVLAGLAALAPGDA
jgi:hypothetical protein